MAAPVIQFKRGLFSNLPGLRAGEPGFTTDKYDLYVGIDSTTNGNKFFGSHRYWTKETTSAGSGVNLVEGTDNGTNAITLKAPASITSDVTYTFPGAAVDQGYLRTNSSGVLSWETGVNATGVSTIAYLQATTANVSAGATVGALTVTGTSSFTGGISANSLIMASGGVQGNVTGNLTGNVTGNINASGVSTAAFLQATTVNASGIVTASSLRAADLRTTGGALIPLVGIQSASAATGIVTAFKFVGTGLDGFTVANNVATISYSGVAATTYTTSQTATATAGQTSFNFTAGYTQGFIDVYLNGIRLITGTDYTASNGSDVVLASAASAGDEIEMVGWKSLGDVINVNTLNSAGDVTVNGGLSVTGITTSTGGFVGALTGNADTATALDNSRDFQVTGDASSAIVSFDGTANVGLAVTLATVNGNIGTFGSQTQVPVITVNGKGLITSVTTAAVGTALTVAGNSGSENINLLTETLSVVGAAGSVSTSAANNSITVDLVNTAVTPGSYGSSTQIPTFTVDAKGRLTAAGTSPVGAALTVTGDSGTETINFLTESLSISGGTNLTSSAASNAVTINLDPNISLTSVVASGIVTASSFSGALTGNSSTATTLQNARDFQVTGDVASAAVSFNGSANVGLAVTLANSGVTAGSYGSSTQIPTFTVDAKGRLTAAGTAAVGAALTVTGDTGSETINFLTESLGFIGGSNLTASAASNAITFDLDPNISITHALVSGVTTTSNLTVTSTSSFTGGIAASGLIMASGGVQGNLTGNVSGNINSSGVSTVTFLKATTATVGAGLTVTGATDLNGGLDVSGGETVLSSATVSDLTSGRVVLAGTSGALEDSGNLTFGANGLIVTGGSNVSAASTFGSNVSIGGSVIISGDLTVNGTTTQVNTVQMTIEDTLIELQMIDGSAPSSDTNKDVGLIMNYYDSSAKKAAFYWDDSVSRFALASVATESSGVVSPTTFGGLEIGSLYLNDCAGASQVISCSGTTRSLENITIDGGSF